MLFRCLLGLPLQQPLQLQDEVHSALPANSYSSFGGILVTLLKVVLMKTVASTS